MASVLSATQSSKLLLKSPPAPAKAAPPAVKTPLPATPPKTSAPAPAKAPPAPVKPSAAAPAKGPELYDKTGAATAAKKTAETNSGGGYISDGNEVVVDIKNSDSGYNNKIYWSTDNFKTRNYIGIDNQTGTVNLGKIAKGTRIDFGIDNGQNQFFRTGGASANSDGVDHTQLTQTSEGTRIGFEDLAGGGDRDFNDAIINVRSVPTETKTTPAAPQPNNNRSGLGDGTNPGLGAGTANSPNQGTLNPAAAKGAPAIATKAAAPVAPPKPVVVAKPPAPATKASAPAPKAAAPTAAKTTVPTTAPAAKNSPTAATAAKSAATLAAATQTMLSTLNKTYGTAAGNGAAVQKLLGSA